MVGDVVFGVNPELTGTGDLFTTGVQAFPKEDMDAVLKAGLAEGGVQNTPPVVAGVLIIVGVGAVILDKMGLRLVVLFRIGVSL